MSKEIYTESWFGEGEAASLRWAIAQVDDTYTGYWVEIGSFEGKSSVFIANEIHPHILECVDSWQGGPVADYELMKYGTTPIEKHFDNNMAVATQGNFMKNKMEWQDFFKADFSISFLYLDGPHDYESVLDSLEIIIPRLVSGGVIVGDDYDDAAVASAVNDFFMMGMASPVWARHFFYKKS